MANILASVQSHMRIRGKAKDTLGNFATLDAGWQLLLYLFTNPPIDRDEALSNLQIHLGFSETTLKRCLRYAESEGYVLTTPNGGTDISLSDQARAKLEQVFADV
jgi:DNA-binding MarR family transcriptional regulator